MSVSLEVPILENGLQFVNFFEGRVLTGRDLRDQASADRRQRMLIGQAAGAGIVSGLEVSLVSSGGAGTLPVVKVQSGLALNRKGEPVLLCQPQDVVLVRAPKAPDGSETIFAVCGHPGTGPEIPSGIGFYVLVIKPASGYEGEAPRSGLGDQGVASGCGKRYATLGVQFRLVPLDPMHVADLAPVRTEIAGLAVLNTPVAQSRLRNLLASACLGSLSLPSFSADPWPPASGASPFATYGALDDLRAAGLLQECEIPLGLLSWTFAGVGFLDMWAVRRRATRAATALDWPLVASDRRRSDAEATFLQFEQHLNDLLGAVPDPETIRAKDYFRFLPSAGLLRLTDSGAAGIDPAVFFSGLNPSGPHPLDGVRVLPLLDASMAHHAIDLMAAKPPLIWRYTVPENTAAAAVPIEAFATGFLPYQGNPLFEIETSESLDDLDDRIDALGASGTTPGTGKGSIRGKVLDPTGAVLAGVSVTIRNVLTAAQTNAITTATGTFTVPNLAPGKYRVSVSILAFASASLDVDLGPGETKDVTLTLGNKNTGVVVGILTDSAGAPKKGIPIDIIDEVTGVKITVMTGADGSYATGPMNPGKYRIEIASGGGVTTEKVTVKKGTGSFVGTKLGR